MFQNQSTFVNPSGSDSEKFNQDSDFKLEDISIHTMEKDLQLVENPSLKKTFYPEKTISATSQPQLTEKQKASPFLTADADKSIFVGNTATQKPSNYSQLNKTLQPNINPSHASNKSSNFIFFIIITFIIILVGAGTYYFITTRSMDNLEEIHKPTTSEKKSIISTTPTNTENSTETPNLFSVDTPNSIIIPNNTPLAIKQVLEEKGQTTVASKITTPIQFTLVDNKNIPLDFSAFAKTTNLLLSEKTLQLIKKDFDLFFFNDHGVIGLGLRLQTTNPVLLKQAMSQEESSLYKNLAFLFPYSEFDPPTIAFQDASYKNYPIRYQNLISPQTLSIDYAFQENSLIIATTKATIEAMLNKSSTS